MPTYKFMNHDTGEVFEKFMSISQADQYLQDNPHITRMPVEINFQLHDAPGKIDDGFKDVLRNINNSGIVNKNKSTLNKYL